MDPSSDMEHASTPGAQVLLDSATGTRGDRDIPTTAVRRSSRLSKSPSKYGICANPDSIFPSSTLSSDAGGLHKVKRILAQRIIREGKVEYRVKVRGGESQRGMLCGSHQGP